MRCLSNGVECPGVAETHMNGAQLFRIRDSRKISITHLVTASVHPWIPGSSMDVLSGA